LKVGKLKVGKLKVGRWKVGRWKVEDVKIGGRVVSLFFWVRSGEEDRTIGAGADSRRSV
jgi:hypothetical protein